MIDSSNSTWRFILHPPSSGSWNMAVDEALLETAIAGQELPALRVYAWEPACLSIGYAQSYKDVDLNQLSKYGYTMVRRPTGGRAILHIDELTYSITASDDHPVMDGGILSSYQRISTAFIRFLLDLGLSPEASEKPTATVMQKTEAICFEVPSNYEITIEGKKIIGSAQARRKTGVLQHGTIPLIGDIRRISNVLIYKDEQAREVAQNRVQERACTIKDALHRDVSFHEAATLLRKAFEDTLQIQLVDSNLTPKEFAHAFELEQMKYAHSEWNERI